VPKEPAAEVSAMAGMRGTSKAHTRAQTTRRSARNRDGAPIDVAVIGGGVAGSYAAYRLVGRRPGWTIGLFERSGRIGGRLLSLRVPGIDDMRAELGGMRYRDSQPLITQLIKKLRLKTRPFLTSHGDNRFFLRGSRWRSADPGDAEAVYRVAEDERGLSPDELLLMALNRIVPGAMALSDDQWVAVRREQRFEGRLLRDWSMGDLLAAVLTEEGHRYVIDGSGYKKDMADRAAADAIPWVLIDVRPGPETLTLVEGMELLPREMAKRFAAAGGRVHLGHDLVGFERAAQARPPGYHLRFKGQPDVTARRIILAVPPRALELLMKGTPLLGTPRTRSLITSVTPYPAAKLFLLYDRPWWRGAGFKGLRTVSDLELSKTYYLDRGERSTRSRSALLLASYSDGSSRDAWRALTDSTLLPLDKEPFDSERRWRSYAAGAKMVAEAQRQLRALHGTDDIPDPVGSAFIDWGADPFGGAWHWWNTGVSSWDVMRRIVQPLPDDEVYICGEAYAWSQAWAEGALESAKRVVDRLI
jgi:monoamine oxidase